MKIKQTRIKLGLTQSAMAELMGMTQQGIQRIEVGKRSETKQQVQTLKMLEILFEHGLIEELKNK